MTSIPTKTARWRWSAAALAASLYLSGCAEQAEGPEGSVDVEEPVEAPTDQQPDEQPMDDPDDTPADDPDGSGDVEDPAEVPTDQQPDEQPVKDPDVTPANDGSDHGAADDGAVDTDHIDSRDLPRTVTVDTPDGTYTLDLDGSAELQLPHDAPPLRVEGTSVEVIDIAFFQDPGYLAWELRGVEPGTTTITTDIDGHSHTWRIEVGGR